MMPPCLTSSGGAVRVPAPRAQSKPARHATARPRRPAPRHGANGPDPPRRPPGARKPRHGPPGPPRDAARHPARRTGSARHGANGARDAPLPTPRTRSARHGPARRPAPRPRRPATPPTWVRADRAPADRPPPPSGEGPALKATPSRVLTRGAENSKLPKFLDGKGPEHSGHLDGKTHLAAQEILPAADGASRYRCCVLHSLPPFLLCIYFFLIFIFHAFLNVILVSSFVTKVTCNIIKKEK